MSEITTRLKTAIAERYAIERELGQGGMATVYLARDVRHDRRVALKVLRPELAAVIGAERFLQEIRVTANLQHSHILPLYDSGAAEGFLFYVMPYVEGETLRSKLAREKQLDVEEAVGLTRAIAGALDHAHRQGIIHRDIKPENILLRDGDPLIADFGIALAVSQAGGNRLTETGLSIGTPHYMSPEQAMGDRQLDPRTDVYSLAVVLYELLTGDPPYQGSTAQAIVAKVITEKAPPVTLMRETVPDHVSAAIQKALNKLPADRFHTAAEFAEALARPGLMSTAARPAASPARHAARWRTRLGAWAGWAVAGIAGATLLWTAFRPEPSRPVSRFSIRLPADQQLMDVRGTRFALSPDGQWLVYVGPGEERTRLWARRRDQLVATPLPGTERAVHVFFAPGGGRLGFVTDDARVKVMSLAGGPPTVVADSGVGLDGAALDDQGYVYFDGFTAGTRVGIPRIRPGGALEMVTTVDTAAGETDHVWPVALPDGRGVLFTVLRGASAESADIAVAPAGGGPHRILLRGVGARYARSGHLVSISTDGTLLAAPFDLGRLELTGEAVSLAEGIAVHPFGAVDLALADDGTLIYATGGLLGSEPQELAWVDRTGRVTPVDSGWTGTFGTVSVAPDGRRLAVSVATSNQEHMWVKQLPRGPLTRLTFDGTTNYRPAWTPDGQSVTFVSNRAGNLDLMVKRADGSAPEKALLDLPVNVQEGLYSRRGDWLVYRVTPRDIYALSDRGDTVPVAATRFEERAPALSPDGRWVAYQSDESGAYQVYVRPFPDPARAKWQVSTDGGNLPRWSPDGRTLFYRATGGNVVAVDVPPGSTFAPGDPRVLFRLTNTAEFEGSWDVAPDGRFLVIRFRGVGASSELIVVEHFFTELEAVR